MLIGKRLIYKEGWHESLKGYEIQIVSVHRGEEILEDDKLIGELKEGDWLEVAPIIKENGQERLSFATHDALASHLNWQD